MLLAYQSDSQVKVAFSDKPTLLYDNCNTQILSGASSHRNCGARVQESGEWTQVLEGHSENTSTSRSWNEGGRRPSQGSNRVTAVPLTTRSTRDRHCLSRMRFCRSTKTFLLPFAGMNPILARRIKWFQDRPSNQSGRIRAETAVLLGLLVAAAALFLRAFVVAMCRFS